MKKPIIAPVNQDFELILENGEIVAALVSRDITDAQLWIIYALLPPRSYCKQELSSRWNIHRVLCTDDWAQAQLHRKPMLPPRRRIKLAFL